MPGTSHSIFEQAGLASGLLSQAEIDRAWEAIIATASDEDRCLNEVTDQLLSNQLVQQGVLNRWQAVQLEEGRTKFTLGPYRVLDTIGRGGMGYVFKCEHELLGRIEAIKVLPRTHMAPMAIASFRREIRAQAQLDHPNLVRLSFADRDGDIYYLVTEFVPGSDLRHLIHSHGPLSSLQAALIISQTAAALQHAHENGLIHRDVKPGNLLVTPTGHTKLTDLGLAVFSSEHKGENRQTKNIVGTPDFLAPEAVLRPNEIAQVSDIYGLGCTFYYAVTGKVPFPGGTTRDKLRRHLEELPLTPQRLAPDLDPRIVDLIADMMRKNPEERLSSASEVVERLELWTTQTDEATWQDLGEYARAIGRSGDSLHETTPGEAIAAISPDSLSKIVIKVEDADKFGAARSKIAKKTKQAKTKQAKRANPGEQYLGLGKWLALLIAAVVATALAALVTVIVHSL